MSDHAKVTEEDYKLFMRLVDASVISGAAFVTWNRMAGAQLLADAIRDAQVKEAKWWAGREGRCNLSAVEREHIEQLKRGEA